MEEKHQGTPSHEITDLRRKRFVEEYSKHGIGSRAIKAIYPECTYPASYASTLLKDPWVKAELAAVRKSLSEKIQYNALDAMKECEDAMEFAKDTRNANAYVKAVELRSKLQGLLVEKIDLRSQSNFSIQIVGVGKNAIPISVNERVALPASNEPIDVIPEAEIVDTVEEENSPKEISTTEDSLERLMGDI